MQKALIKNTWTEIGHSVVCPKHGPLVDTKRHCHNIARFFLASENYYSSKIYSWFQIASGIVEVKYVSDLHDDSMFQCNPSMEYEDAKSDFHSRLIRELTRFSFIWGGFESYCDAYPFSPCPAEKKRGSVNAVNHFLKTTYLDNYSVIPFYDEVIEHLKKIIGKNPWHGNTNELFSSDACTSDKVSGLKAVYKIRNSFAHGALKFSEPDGWGDVKPYDIGIINTSSKVLLMTLQMLLLSRTTNLKLKVSQLNESDEFGVSAEKYLPKLHLKSFKHS
jgi:hypothetical protein